MRRRSVIGGRAAVGAGLPTPPVGLAPSVRSVGTAALILAVALVTWVVTVDRMSGMDSGPGADPGALGWYLGLWVTMMAAMMLPSVAPMALVFRRVSSERARRGRASVPTWVFLVGYLGVWTAYGLAAYGAMRGLRALDPAFLAWDRTGPLVAGAAVAAAGVYQLTPLKRACLGHCRSPLHFVMRGWREGRIGAVRMGVEHGAWCVGCCWGLMLILLTLGVMSLRWMAVVGAVIFAEKVLPFGARLPRAIALVLVGAGLWIGLAPESVPGLTEPGTSAMPAGDGMKMGSD